MAVVELLYVTVLCCLSPQASDGEDSVGLDNARESLPRLNRFMIDEEGRLRVDQNSWEEKDEDAEAEDEEEKDENLTRLEQLRRDPFGGRGQPKTPITTVLQGIMDDTGTRSRGSGWGGSRSHMNFEGPELRGRYVLNGTALAVEMQELVGRRRSIQLIDHDDVTRLLIYSPQSSTQILRSPAGVHVCSMKDGDVQSLVGSSFVDLVKQNTDYFQNTLGPQLSGIADLPIEKALESKSPDSKPAAFEPSESENPLRNPEVVSTIAPLAQFRLVDRQLAFNRVYGKEGVIDDEVTKIKAEVQGLITKAVADLEAVGATQMQIADLRRQLHLGVVEDQQFAGLVAMNPSIEQTLFTDVRVAMKGRYSGGMRGGDRYEVKFEAYDRSAIRQNRGTLSKNKDYNAFYVADSKDEVRLITDKNFSLISVTTDLGLISISQSRKPAACSLHIVDPSGSKIFKGSTFVSMVQSIPNEEWAAIQKRFAEYGIGGLDIFSEKNIEEIARRLKGEMPERFEDPMTGIESVVFPLMNDPQYLQAIQKQMPDEVQKALRKRIVMLRKAEK